MGFDAGLLPAVVGNPKITSQFQGGFFQIQVKQAGCKINHIPVCLTAEAVKPPVNLHAGILVIVKRADAHPILTDRDTVKLSSLSGCHILLDRFKHIQNPTSV